MGAAGDPDHRRRRAHSATSCAWDGAMSSRPRRVGRAVAARPTAQARGHAGDRVVDGLRLARVRGAASDR